MPHRDAERQKEEHRLLALAADVGTAVSSMEQLDEMLNSCAQALVNHLPAAFARIWVLSADRQTLQMAASAGIYTYTKGTYSRIKVGEKKIGKIAAEKRPHLTNDVLSDPSVDREWAEKTGMSAFAGYPLLIEDKLVGAMAMFSYEPLGEATLTALAAVAGNIAIGIKRKQSEQALLISERRYRAMFDTAPDGILTLGQDGKIESVNRAAATMFGYTEPELLDCHVCELMPDFFGENPSKMAENRLLTGEKRIFGSGRELMGRRKDGSTFPVELALSIANLGPNSIFMGMIRDITARKTIEEQLRQQNKLFAQFGEIVRDVFWISSPGLDKYYYVSPAYEHIWGRPCEELYNDPMSFLNSVVSEDRERILNHIKNEMNQPDAQSIEFRVTRSDGEIRWLLVRTFPMIDATGQIMRICGVTSDFTERKNAEKRVSEFYSMVSHELRTPLTSIRAALGLIEGGVTGGVPGETMDLVRIARAESDRLIRLINDILDIRKIEAGKYEFHIRPLVGADLVNATFAALRWLAHEHKVELVSWINDERLVLGDRDRVIQVLTNLLSNAIKYSPSGGTVTASVSFAGDPSFARFSVSDKGPGIPANQLDKLFGVFQQLDSSDSRSIGGTGLGLAISKAIVERLGGRIGLTSEVGKGATFWFDLPVLKSSCSIDPSAPKEEGPIEELLDECSRSFPQWLADLNNCLELARQKNERGLIDNALQSVRRIKATAEPCGFPEIANDMNVVEDALINICEQKPSNQRAVWQEIDRAMDRTLANLSTGRNNK